MVMRLLATWNTFNRLVADLPFPFWPELHRVCGEITIPRSQAGRLQGKMQTLLAPAQRLLRLHHFRDVLDRANRPNASTVLVANRLRSCFDVAQTSLRNDHPKPRPQFLFAMQRLSATLLDRRPVIRVNELHKFDPGPRTLSQRQAEQVTGLLRPGEAVFEKVVFPVPQAREAGGCRHPSLERFAGAVLLVSLVHSVARSSPDNHRGLTRSNQQWRHAPRQWRLTPPLSTNCARARNARPRRVAPLRALIAELSGSGARPALERPEEGARLRVPEEKGDIGVGNRSIAEYGERHGLPHVFEFCVERRALSSKAPLQRARRRVQRCGNLLERWWSIAEQRPDSGAHPVPHGLAPHQRCEHLFCILTQITSKRFVGFDNREVEIRRAEDNACCVRLRSEEHNGSAGCVPWLSAAPGT